MSPEELAQFRADVAARTKAWAKANPEKVKARVRRPTAEKLRLLAERKVARDLQRQANKQAQLKHRAAYKANYHAANREKLNRERQERYMRNRAAHLAKCKEWARENRDQLAAYKIAWNEANKAKLQEQAKARAPKVNAKLRHRRLTDVQFAILGRLRTRMRKALFAQGAIRSAAAKVLIGCAPEEFRDRIESQFLPGMNWDNRSDWHLDHKMPCASFDLTDSAQQKACFHYSNIRPIWGPDNMRKGAKILPEFLPTSGEHVHAEYF